MLRVEMAGHDARSGAAVVRAALLALAVAVTAGCAPGGATPEGATMSTAAPFSITSTAFSDGGPIPVESTCRGQDVSPELAWLGVPEGTGALVLFVDDPDGRDWVHWSVLDLPGADGGLAAGIAPRADPPQQGTNDFGRVGYGGPCPPSGTHHYRFTLYALAAPLGLPGHPDGRAVRAALGRASVLATARLTGTFAH
jgi:Raf kinase inhibitor-like YbhB/YbcL family protein